jgi:hypothetical protein
MFKNLDTVPDEYFYQFLAARDTGKRARIKGLWAAMILSGVFLLFSSIFVNNSRPRVEYSYYCNLVFVILFGVQILLCLFFSVPGTAGKLQKFYWAFVFFNVMCFQFSLCNACVAVMGLEALPLAFFLLIIFVIFGGLVLNLYILKRAVKRIPQGHYKENGTRLFDDKNGKIKKRWAIVSMLIASFTLPIIIFIYITFRLVHVSNAFLLVFISFFSVFLLIIMSFVNYFPILQIYCVNRFPTSEFTAAKIKKNKKTEQA